MVGLVACVAFLHVPFQPAKAIPFCRGWDVFGPGKLQNRSWVFGRMSSLTFGELQWDAETQTLQDGWWTQNPTEMILMADSIVASRNPFRTRRIS